MFIYSRTLFVTTGLHELFYTGIYFGFFPRKIHEIFSILNSLISFISLEISIKLTVLRMNLYSDQVGLVRLKILKNAVLFYSYPRLLILSISNSLFCQYLLQKYNRTSYICNIISVIIIIIIKQPLSHNVVEMGFLINSCKM